MFRAPLFKGYTASTDKTPPCGDYLASTDNGFTNCCTAWNSKDSTMPRIPGLKRQLLHYSVAMWPQQKRVSLYKGYPASADNDSTIWWIHVLNRQGLHYAGATYPSQTMPLQQAMAPLFQIYKALSDKGSNLQWLPGLRKHWLHYLGALGLKGLHPEDADQT